MPAMIADGARQSLLSDAYGRVVERAQQGQVVSIDLEVAKLMKAHPNSGMTAEDFDKTLKAQNMSVETLREEARKDLSIAALQDK